MKIGAIFPQTEIGNDAGAIAEYGRAIEAMGYDYLVAYDHVLGANTASRPDWKGPYTLDSTFHEPFVLFAYLAAVTKTLGFATGIVILPQRQTALVAKQAACLDVLSGGRLRLGVATGWNDVEYEALGVPFAERGARIEEQVAVLRALFTQPAVTFRGAYHSIPDAGINPLPVQRPIPIWMGGGSGSPVTKEPPSDRVYRRIARLADGWMPGFAPDDRGRELWERVQGYCREEGRDPSQLGLEGRLTVKRQNEGKWADVLGGWKRLGASHVSVGTMGDGLRGAEAHLRRLEEVRALAEL
ncbi:MAG TPA: LLM class F420-dependent oxidoreductase [Polyangiaceae bacterium]